MVSEDAPKLCNCGCGLPAPIAKRTRTIYGHVKGQPIRYIKGHATGKHEVDPHIQYEKELACRRRYKKESKDRCKAYVLEYLLSHPCIDCGETNPIVLDFDHKNPKDKFKTISQIAGWALGFNHLVKEIEKCDIRCANCHRIRHHNQPYRELIGYY